MRRNVHRPDQLRAMILEAGRELIREKGVEGIRARPLAARIGYAVGTLYNAFDDLDDIVEQINVETLGELHEALVRESIPEGPALALQTLAQRYCRFVVENQALWRAVVAYPFAPRHQRSEPYNAEIMKIFQLIYDVTAPLYEPSDRDQQIHDARVLWSCLYGVQALFEESRYPANESIDRMVSTVVRMYLASRLDTQTCQGNGGGN